MDHQIVDALVSKHLIGTHDQSDHSRKQHGTTKDKNALTTRQRRSRIAGGDIAATARGTSYTGLNTKNVKNISDAVNLPGRVGDKFKSDSAGSAATGVAAGAMTGAALGAMSGSGKLGAQAGAQRAVAAGLTGAALGGASDALRRKRKREGKNVSKAMGLYEEVAKFRMPKMKKPRINLSNAPRGTADLQRRASSPMRNAGNRVRTAGDSARKFGQSGMGAVRSNPRRAAAIGGGAAAVGGGAAFATRDRKKDQFGKADRVYEIAKGFRDARANGEIGHEYDLTTDPELYTEVAERFVAKAGSDNVGSEDVDAVYAELGGDWVPVEDVLTELAKALYVGDDETAELIAYAIS